jgi:glycosyltransferase involved in cell wall biosynthesis
LNTLRTESEMTVNRMAGMGLQEGVHCVLEDIKEVGKVLVIAGHFPPMQSGEAAHAFQLSQHLQQRGYEVDVLTSRGVINANGHGITVHPVMQDWSWRELPSFMKVIRRCSPDVILLMYIGLIYNDHPMVTYAPTISKLVLPAAAFVTLFEYPRGAKPWKMPLASRIVRKTAARLAGSKDLDYYYGTLLRDSDRIIVLSDWHRATLAKNYPGVNTKTALIPPPPLLRILPDEDGTVRKKARKVLGVKDGEILIAYFGYIYEGKGVDTLLKAFAKLSKSLANARLVLIGGGILTLGDLGGPAFEKTMRQLPKELGIQNELIWPGEYAWDSDEGSEYLHAADLCVLPFDNGVYLNNSSLGAVAAHGLPIITTQGEFVEPQFIHKFNVFLCAPQSTDVLADAMGTVISDPLLREQLAAGARQLGQEWFSWEKATQRITTTFKAAKRAKGRSAAYSEEPVGSSETHF